MSFIMETLSFKELVNKLSSWQRNQWARDGYPGLHKQDIDKLTPYLTKNKKTINIVV